MLKNYIVGGKQYQYEEGKQPAGAIEVGRPVHAEEKAEEPANKAKRPANKAAGKAGAK